MNRSYADRLFWLSFAILSLLNLLVLKLSPLNLAPDEAHYWDWSRRLDWSYYSKGPLVAYLIAGGRAIFGDTEFGVRFPAFLCLSFFSAGFYYFLRRFSLPLYAFLGWLALRSMLIFAQTGIVMTTDAPAALFWFLALAAAYLAVIEERRAFWLCFGLAIGVGMWAKYTVIFLYISVLIFVAVHSQLRNHLRSKEFLAGSCLIILCLFPILYWNSMHDWVNFAHNAGHLVRDKGFQISPMFALELMLGQAGLVGPIVFFALGYAMIRGFRSWRKGDIAAGLLLSSCAPLAVFVLAISFTKRIYANWPLPIYIGALALFVHLLTKRQISWQKHRRIIRAGLIVSAALTLAAHLPFLGYTLGIRGKILPTKKLVGWRDLGAIVDEKLSTIGSVPEAYFVLGDDYEVVSSVAFYSSLHPQGYCARLDGRRMNQYDIWGGWERLRGKNAVIVLRSKEKVEKLVPHFDIITPTEPSPALQVEYSGTPLRDFYIFFGRGYDGSVPSPAESY